MAKKPSKVSTKGSKAPHVIKKPSKSKEPQPQTEVPSGSGDGATGGGGGIWKDARFQHLLADPRFRGVPKVQRKVKIDKRFEGMFKDDKFKVKYTVDKYGRPVNKSNADDLRKFYDLGDSSNDDDDDDEEEDEKEKVADKSDSDADADAAAAAADEDKERRAEELAIGRDDENDALDESDVDSEVPENLRERLTNPNIDYARGEGRLVTDSSSDEESSDDDEEGGPELKIDHVWGELDNDAETTEESTRRLAVCNMDWDRIRAQDLMVLLNSFLPPGGIILSVIIYPSEFGKERMAEEERHGPTELVGTGKTTTMAADTSDDDDDDDDDDELVQEQDSDAAEQGDDYHMEKLRKYQLNRLRYYYAVVECDSVATADKLYKECDGIEYESSATRVDLRFIPDDTTFDDDEPHDSCYELPEAGNYKPRQFTTTALQQAKVDLTWDETALERRELGDKLSSGKVDQLNDKELRQIVAYSTEEEEEEEDEEDDNNDKADNIEDEVVAQPLDKKMKRQQRIDKYKSLLSEINEQEQQQQQSKHQHKYEMEMTWEVNQQPEKEQEKSLSLSQSQTQLTPMEKLLQKRSEKNKQRKEERRRRKQRKTNDDDDEDDNDDEDEDSLPDGIDMNDSYFAEEFANGDYEPAKKHPKSTSKSKAKRDKQKRKQEQSVEDERQQEELALLLDDDDDNNGDAKRQHFSLAKILDNEQESRSSKRKRRKLQAKQAAAASATATIEDDFTINVNDDRFAAVFKSHEYNIDPSDARYKGTKGMQQFIGEKVKRRNQDEATTSSQQPPASQQPAKRAKQIETNLLVKSLKRKIEQQRAK